MNNLHDSIENQLAFNAGKNLLHEGAISSLVFTPETLAAIERFGEIDITTENLLIDYLTDKVLQEFCRVNQYYSFDKQNRKDLRDIYIDLFSRIRNTETTLELTAKIHYENLKKWLLKANSFAGKMYTPKDELVEPVACHEYSAELQLTIFQIDTDKIAGPVLDIGCGKQGNLVKHLRRSGIAAYGCDRFAESSPFLSSQDWFEFVYGRDKWGTITSNLGFSNHFNHNHLRNDGRFIEYAKTYMDILNSLKIGGSFHYAPGLPFIEKYLDQSKFRVEMQKIGNSEVKSVRIMRLK